MKSRSRAFMFLRDRNGNFATMSAIMAPVALGAAALAVDAGSIYAERRNLQAMADISAIAAAPRPDEAARIVLATLQRNGVANPVILRGGDDPAIGLSGATLVHVDTGRYVPDPARSPAARFEAGASSPNAVRVRLEKDGTRFFALAFPTAPRMSASGLASARDIAAFSIGSRLLALDGGVVNAVLGGLLGVNLNLSVMDYEALLDADIRISGLLSAVATELDLTAGTYRDVLDAEIRGHRFAASLARVEGLSLGVRTAFQRLAATPGLSGRTLKLGELIDLGPESSRPVGSQAADEARVGALELVSAVAVLSEGGRQVDLSGRISVPGLLGLDLALAIGEPPQGSALLAVGESGRVVRTAQTRMRLEARLGGGGILAGASIRLPVHLEIAHAEASLADIDCAGGTGQPRVMIAARPGVADIRIAEASSSGFADFSRPQSFSSARIVDLALARVRGSAQARIERPAEAMLSFDAAAIARGTVKSVSTTGMAGSLAGSLLSDLDLDIQVLGIGIGIPGAVRAALTPVLSAATPALDLVLDNTLAALGVRVGEADIRVTEARCGRSVLVQ